jgi:hypothetical protein
VRSLPTIALHDLSFDYEKLDVHALKVNYAIVAITTREGIKKTLETQAA